MTDVEFAHRARIAKIAEAADFDSDMTHWPDSMVHAYLDSNGVEQVARRLFHEALLEEAGLE